MFDSQNRPFLRHPTWSKMNPQRAKIAEPGPDAQWDGALVGSPRRVVPLGSLHRDWLEKP